MIAFSNRNIDFALLRKYKNTLCIALAKQTFSSGSIPPCNVLYYLYESRTDIGDKCMVKLTVLADLGNAYPILNTCTHDTCSCIFFYFLFSLGIY